MRAGTLTHPLEALAWDTRHFGVKMGRVIFTPDAAVEGVSATLAEATHQGFQQLMTRAAPRDTELLHALEDAGFRLMDTLVTLQLDLSALPAVSEPPRAFHARVVRAATNADQNSLMAIARNAFADREVWLDRFHADPRLNAHGRADDLYVQWAKNSVAPATPNNSMADHVLVAGPEQGTPMGFITCRRGSATTPGVVSLNAVNKIARRHGVYRLLVHHALQWFEEQGTSHVTIRTSITSQAIHRTWFRLGATLSHVEHTFHWWAETAR